MLRSKELALQAAFVSRGTVTSYVSATGAVINREELTMNSPVSGQLLDVRVNEGDDLLRFISATRTVRGREAPTRT